LKKQREIDRLTEELQRLKQKLRYQEREGLEGFFGSSTPSPKLPVKANTPPAKPPKRKWARPGHAGVGRQTFGAHEAKRIIEVATEVSDRCPRCDLPLEDKGTDGRLVLDSHLVKAERVLYRLPKKYCPRWRQTFQPRAPAVLPKSLYGNQLIATMEEPAQHLGIRRIQAIFRANGDRLYHWAEDRRIPADNNLAERDLRPTVIARKVSFGSQSDAGAQTRGVLMSVLHTLKKRQVDVVAQLKRVLDQLALDLHQDPFLLLFPEAPT
jgi:hypothetical protein